MAKGQVLVLFQETPEDSKPWCVGTLDTMYQGGGRPVIMDLNWFEEENDARAFAHRLEHGSNR